MENQKTMVIKIGTNVICNKDGTIDTEVMENIVSQFIRIQYEGYKLVIVSSGAVGMANSSICVSPKVSVIERKQILASVGQPFLILEFKKLFAKGGHYVGQILVTKEDFRDRNHYLHIKRCIEGLFRHGIIPIVNENDPVSVNEMTFTDNDELAGLLAAMISANKLIILTSVDGLFDGDPDDPSSNVISQVDIETTDFRKFIKAKKTKLGRGGMNTKFEVAEKAASMGIPVNIINGKVKDNILSLLLEGKHVGTKFLPKKELSSKKKWIAHAHGYEKSTIVISEKAESVLKNPEKVASLLPIGVLSVYDDCKKGEIVKIKTFDGRDFGMGVANYGTLNLRKVIGKKDQKAFVLYDNLVVF